jgi:hypothetical protein
MSEWQKELEEELRSGLVAYAEDGREIQVGLDFDAKEGTLRLQWEDADNQPWFLTIPHDTLMALMNAMAKRLYPTARSKGRTKATGGEGRSEE